MASDLINSLRKEIADSKISELEMYANDDGVKDMLDTIQNLRSKMNVEIMDSIKTITQKYQEEIDELEEQYALLVALKGQNNV